jgi:sterol desaturase/sphingolipid hydroxylase (fatty acid hydroxylase superfamily)
MGHAMVSSIPPFAFLMAVLCMLLVLESVVAARACGAPRERARRLVRHGVMSGLGSLAGAVVLPLGLVGLAAAGLAPWQGIGALPGWAAFVLGWAVMDAAVWAQHRAFHAVPWLWRLHRVHHGDTVMDVSTGLRFHPGELVLSLLWKGLVAVLLGVPPEAVAAFQIGLSAMALFTHANIALPGPVERVLRTVIVTPQAHLVHHHPQRAFTDSNFGNLLSLWDRLAGTWRERAPDGALGLGGTARPDTLASLLADPFRR